MTKKMVGCYEMGIYWFQVPWENNCVLDKVLSFIKSYLHDKDKFHTALK